jgi:hypothetical protein
VLKEKIISLELSNPESEMEGEGEINGEDEEWRGNLLFLLCPQLL